LIQALFYSEKESKLLNKKDKIERKKKREASVFFQNSAIALGLDSAAASQK